MEIIANTLREWYAIPWVRFALNLLVAVAAALIIKGLIHLLWKGKKAQGDPRPPALSRVENLTALLVFFLFLPPVFRQLGWNGAAESLVQVTRAILAWVPRLFAGGLVLLVGDLIATVVQNLTLTLLSKRNPSGTVSRALYDFREGISCGVKLLILLFFVAQALEILQLELLRQIAGAIVRAIPYLLKAGAVVLGAYLADLLFLKKWQGAQKMASTAIRLLLYTVAGFLVLDQLEIAPAIVDSAFLILMIGGTAAFVLSFGLGAKDFASRFLTQWEKKLRDQNESNTSDPKSEDPSHKK